MLHRFSSKYAIYRAAASSALAQTTELVERVNAILAGAQRDRAVLEALLDAAVQWPGAAALLQSVVSEDPTGVAPGLSQAGELLLGAFGLNLDPISIPGLVRLISATSGL